MIKNNKGFALLEGLIIMIVAFPFLFFLLRSLVAVISTVALDAMAEDFFFCELARKKHCQQRLVESLTKIHMHDPVIRVSRGPKTLKLTINTVHLNPLSIEREFNHEKFSEKF